MEKRLVVHTSVMGVSGMQMKMMNEKGGFIMNTTPGKLLIEVQELQTRILDYVGSESYYSVLQSLEDTKVAGFMMGLSIAAILASSECSTYMLPVDKIETDDED
jgi:hypothetical protein